MFTVYKRERLLASAGLASLMIAAAASTAAYAQEAAQDTASDDAAVEEIVVTGSRIARKDYVANSPIVTVGQQDFQDTGSVTIDTLLNDMPQFVPQSNFTSNNPSNGGQANLQLRGLGSQRTLVLMNGRRVVGSNSDGTVDVNVIPTALIKNIEVITGGASATYGSDALAGVTNFILRDDFEGIQVDAQYGQTSRGDGETQSVSVTMGGNFADDRGNAVLSLGYSNRGEIFNAARPFSSVSGASATTPLGSTIFDATNLPSQAAVTAAIAGGKPGDTFGFNNDGSVFTYKNRNGFVSPGGIDYDGFAQPGATYNPNFAYNTGALNYLAMPLTRYNVFASGTYEVNKWAKAYGQALFTQYESTQILAPTPAAGSATGFRVKATNPFIPAELKSLLNSRTNPNGTFRLDKRFNTVGPREGVDNYDVFQIVTGVKGDLPIKDWSYDVYAQMGRVDRLTTQNGNISRSAVQTLLDAADGGNSICAGGFNPFGDNAMSAACAAYVGRTSKNSTRSDQRVIEATVQGGLFDLPAGEVRFAAGMDYREDEYTFTPDALLSTGDVAGFNAQKPLEGVVDVKEYFGEVLIPVLRDLPFVEELNLNLASRISDYSSIGQVGAYKIDGDWLIGGGVRARGGFQRAVRAPSIGELYAPQNLTFASIGTPSASGNGGDPCDVGGKYRTGPNAAQVKALCAAQGVPGAIIDSYTYTNTQASGLTGGNPDLKEETADTFSVGLVWQPRFDNPWLEKLSGSIDYYSIEIADVIASVATTDQLQLCYNANGTSNPTYDPNHWACQMFSRNPATGEVIGAKEFNGNLGALRTSGIDFQVDWGFTFADVGLPDLGKMKFNVTGTKLQKWEIQNVPNGAFTDRTGTISNSFGMTFPEWKWLAGADWSYGPASLGVRWRYQGEVENFNDTSKTIDAVNYFDLNSSWSVNDKVALRAGINNLTDEMPPVYTPAIQANTDPSTYDVLGRRFYLGLTAKF
ncbi:TonB-dependent receptor domain-containing protein [Caulobacter sp. 17J80-11]|uniref:TonB-dependent receptor domain-containing protein n=1 Tax=Caulobacter sp. 17J80-11 TaxID=2763502 RepID=UPI002103F43D|nr:TonB-dependent receptor [Caulobacter sp. 17J80-11]